MNGLTVGSVGLAIPRKGIDTFLELAQKFPKNQFIWFGAIYSSVIAKPLPKDLPKNVTFTGYVDDIVAAMNSLDVFIFPSYEENQGMAILEAGVLGLPLLVRDLPVYKGWLRDGENCLKAKDDAQFAAHLAMLLENDKRREELGKAAAHLAVTESTEAIGQKVEGYYQKLISKVS